MISFKLQTSALPARYWSTDVLKTEVPVLDVFQSLPNLHCRTQWTDQRVEMSTMLSQSPLSTGEDEWARIITKSVAQTPCQVPLSIVEEKRKITNRAKALIRRSDAVIKNSLKDLQEARIILEPAGLTVESSILDPTFGIHHGETTVVAVLRTTGGHSNTDHLVKITGDPRKDRIEELKRNYQRRIRSSQPESRGEDRWDKPKIPGERRRRIVREKDLPQAPPEPPQTGYVFFVGQMTTKIRHDRPDEPHNQTKVVQEISKIWKFGMAESEREYYNEAAREARVEYQRLHQEYRATGRYQPSTKFVKLKGVGPWVRVAWHDKNGLERELATYETVSFPLRPPKLDEAYEQRQLESIKRRKLKRTSGTLTKSAEETPSEEGDGNLSTGSSGASGGGDKGGSDVDSGKVWTGRSGTSEGDAQGMGVYNNSDVVEERIFSEDLVQQAAALSVAIHDEIEDEVTEIVEV